MEVKMIFWTICSIWSLWSWSNVGTNDSRAERDKRVFSPLLKYSITWTNSASNTSSACLTVVKRALLEVLGFLRLIRQADSIKF